MIPVPWLVGHRVYGAEGWDAHGNPVEAWSDPVPLRVHAVAPRTDLAGEPTEPGRYLIVEGLTIYAPAGTTVGEHDRIIWPYRPGMPETQWIEHDVDGPVADWTAGPWPHPTAGVTIDLKRTEG